MPEAPLAALSRTNSYCLYNRKIPLKRYLEFIENLSHQITYNKLNSQIHLVKLYSSDLMYNPCFDAHGEASMNLEKSFLPVADVDLTRIGFANKAKEAGHYVKSRILDFDIVLQSSDI